MQSFKNGSDFKTTVTTPVTPALHEDRCFWAESCIDIAESNENQGFY